MLRTYCRETAKINAVDLLRFSLQVKILGIPPSGAKSRVETQIKLCLQLLTPLASAGYGPTFGLLISFKGEKVTTWKYLRIPDELLPSDKATDNIGRFLSRTK